MIRARAATCLLTLSLAWLGCPICPSPEMAILEGAKEVHPGNIVQLRATYSDWVAGPSHCTGHWYVDGVEGGGAELGTVDSCGRYQAPAMPFPDDVTRIDIAAAQYAPGTCLDCCPYAAITLYPRP